MTMAVGQIVGCGAVRFSLGVAQGYDDYGRWPNCGLGAVRFSLGVAQGYVDYGRWPNCGLGAPQTQGCALGYRQTTLQA